MSKDYSVVAWTTFRKKIFAERWRYGQHSIIINKTGGGKSTLALNLIKNGIRSVILDYKPFDEMVKHFINSQHYDILHSYPPPKEVLEKIELAQHDKLKGFRVNVSPVVVKGNSYFMYEGATLVPYFDYFVYDVGRCVIYIDELEGMMAFKRTGFYRAFQTAIIQARANKVSLLYSTQQPKNIPTLATDQATYFFMSRTIDKDTIRMLSEKAGIEFSTLYRVLSQLERYRWLFVDTLKGDMVIFSPPKI